MFLSQLTPNVHICLGESGVTHYLRPLVLSRTLILRENNIL